MRGTILSGTLAAKLVLLNSRNFKQNYVTDERDDVSAPLMQSTFSSPSSVDPLRLLPQTPPQLLVLTSLRAAQHQSAIKTIFCSLNLSRPLPGLLLGGGLVHLPVRPEIIVRFSLVPPLRTYADITSILICLPAFIEYLSSSLPTTPPDRYLAA